MKVQFGIQSLYADYWFIVSDDAVIGTAGPYCIGPAGGFVFYDCDADNDKGNSDGLISLECGWRYLEAAPVDLGVVNNTPILDPSVDYYYSSYDQSEFVYGYYRTSSSGSNLYENGNAEYVSGAVYVKTGLGNGMFNTELIVGAMQDSAYTASSGSETTANYAARLCSVLSYEYNGVVFDDWYLPNNEEMVCMKENLTDNGIHIGGRTEDKGYFYWTSWGPSPEIAYAFHYSNGTTDYISRSKSYYIRPVRSF